MKWYRAPCPPNENQDESLIDKLKEVDDINVTDRAFGVQIQNIHYQTYSIKKKNHYSLENLKTCEYIREEEFRTDKGNLPCVEKTYRINILKNLVNRDIPIKIIKQNHHQRNLIVNWLVLIHSKYPFQSQTLHEAVRIFDRFISHKEIDVLDYEKYALTAYWISAKMEERKVKELKLWVTFGKGHILSEILELELEILQALNFQLASNTSQRFLYNFATFFFLTPKAFILCNYLLQLTLLSIQYLKYPSSIVALGCLLVCSKVLRKQMSSTTLFQIQKLSQLFCLPVELVYDCSKKICRALQQAPKNLLSSVYRKYSSKKYMKIALIHLGRT